MMARMVPSGRIRPRWYGTITCLPVTGFRHFWWLPELPAILNPLWRRMAITSSAVRRGVPRSPNDYLDKFGILRQLDIGRGKIEANGILDIAACFCFGISRRSAPRQLRADRRPALGNGIIFENDAELHSPSIRWFAVSSRIWPFAWAFSGVMSPKRTSGLPAAILRGRCCLMRGQWERSAFKGGRPVFRTGDQSSLKRSNSARFRP
jgi:hypothetical protein